MQQIPVLAVRGEAALDVEPEIARIEVSVAATDTDRARTLQLLAERAAAVEKVLESFPDVIERSESSGARISPQQAGRPLRDREERGYLGAMHHAITVTGFDRLGEPLGALARGGLARGGSCGRRARCTGTPGSPPPGTRCDAPATTPGRLAAS